MPTMGTLYLVRHGQASFGADDYDQLSALGRRQSVRLGEYLRSKGLSFDAVLTGTLRRHAQTWDGIAEGAGAAALAAALQEREQLRGQVVGLALTGGNVDASVLAQVLARQG